MVLFQNFLSPTADSKDLDCVKRLWSEEGSSFSYKKIYYLITNQKEIKAHAACMKCEKKPVYFLDRKYQLED